MSGYGDGLPEWDGQPGMDELTAQLPPSDRGPGELRAAVLHHMGEADAPPRARHLQAPDVSDLRRELGL